MADKFKKRQEPDMSKKLTRWNATYWASMNGIQAVLTNAQWSIFTALCTHLPNVMPGSGRLERISHTSASTVIRARQFLRRVGLISYDDIKGGDRSKAIRYSITDFRPASVSNEIVGRILSSNKSKTRKIREKKEKMKCQVDLPPLSNGLDNSDGTPIAVTHTLGTVTGVAVSPQQPYPRHPDTQSALLKGRQGKCTKEEEAAPPPMPACAGGSVGQAHASPCSGLKATLGEVHTETTTSSHEASTKPLHSGELKPPTKMIGSPRRLTSPKSFPSGAFGGTQNRDSSSDVAEPWGQHENSSANDEEDQDLIQAWPDQYDYSDEPVFLDPDDDSDAEVAGESTAGAPRPVNARTAW